MEFVNKRPLRKNLIIWLLSGVMILSGLSDAQLKLLPDNLLDLSLKDLMEIEIPVTSASRQSVRLRYLSAATTVITAEDIHLSGLTTIPEILQFTPGVDVRRLDRQRSIVGVRGLLGMFSDRTVVLIDGRPAIDPASSTMYWENLPVLMEDIDRIEIVRGPGGAVWGNAFNGVINIITKKPEQCQGGLISTTVNEFGDTYTHLRYGHKQGPWSWKVSAGYENTQDSDSAGAGKYISGWPEADSLIGFDSYEARDWGRYWKFDTQAEYRANEQTRWSFGAAHSSSQEGDFEFIGVFPRRDFLTEYTRLFARMDHQIDRDTNVYFQWFGDYSNAHRRVMIEHQAYMENDFETQLNFKPADDHNTSVVGNFRWTRMSMDNYSSANEFVFDRNDYNEYWAGIFFIDRWTITERLTAEGQICLNYYSPTSTDWSTRLTALYALDEQQNHILRASFARAFRTPTVGLRQSSSSYLWDTSIINPPADNHLDNEGTYSLEAGYVGHLTDNISLDIDTYYQRYERLIGMRTVDESLAQISTIGNINGADAWGGETSLVLRHRAGRITAWYAYNAFVPDESNQNTRSLSPADHKVGLNTRWYIDKDWTFNTNYVFQNSIRPEDTAIMKNSHGFHRLDLTLSRKFAKGKGELMIGVTDVLNETTHPVYDVSNFTALETPGRTFFGRVQIKF